MRDDGYRTCRAILLAGLIALAMSSPGIAADNTRQSVNPDVLHDACGYSHALCIASCEAANITIHENRVSCRNGCNNAFSDCVRGIFTRRGTATVRKGLAETETFAK